VLAALSKNLIKFDALAAVGVLGTLAAEGVENKDRGSPSIGGTSGSGFPETTPGISLEKQTIQ